MTGPTFLVRHGEDGRDGLTAEGTKQAEAARDELLALGLGSTAILLSSNAQRALNTAMIIAGGLDTPVRPSQRINTAGNHAAAVKNLDSFLEETLRRLGLSRGEDQPLVVVTHAPLVAVAKGLDINDTDKVGNGEVAMYTHGTWTGSFYREPIEEIYAGKLNSDHSHPLPLLDQ